MNRLALFGLTALTITVFAEEEIAAGSRSSGNKTQATPAQTSTGVTLATARPESDNGWYTFADVLYWHADVNNADWAWMNESVSASEASPPILHGENRSFSFKWSWGFRVGIGMNMDHDEWDSNLYYTWFYTKNSTALGVGEDQFAVAFLPPEEFNSLRHIWSIHFSMFDWELGRWYHVSKNLSLRPHIGIKGGWIHQLRNQHASGAFRENDQILFGHSASKMTNDFWGVGPSAGLNTMWILGSAGVAKNHRFSLFGDVSGAFMYGHFDNDFSIQAFADDSGALVREVKISNLDRNLATAMLQGILGFSWDVPFNRDRSHFTFRAGYEFQYWFDQNQFLQMKELSDDMRYSRYDANLKFQGLTFDFRFDF